MRKITEYSFYFLAFLLPFGSVNPFNLSAATTADSRTSEQLGFAPVVLAICCIFAFFDSNIFRHRAKIRKFIWPLVIMFAALLTASILYNGHTSDFPIVYLLKLFSIVAGFYIMALYFMEYPQTLERSMLIYAYVCTLIIVAFFAGFLSNYTFTSSGRLYIFGENPNSFSFLMNLGAIILTYKFNRTKSASIYIKIFDVVAIVLLLLYIILSGSRGSFLIVIVCMAVLLFNKRMIKKVWVIVPLIVGAIAVGFYYYSSHEDDISLFNRLSNAEGDERTILQEQTFELFLEQPILGYGVNGYKCEMRYRHGENRDSHNMVITMMGMSGIIGGIAVVCFLFLLGRMSWKYRRINILALALLLDVFLMSMKTGGVLTFSMMWYTYAMVVALAQPSKKLSMARSGVILSANK